MFPATGAHQPVGPTDGGAQPDIPPIYAAHPDGDTASAFLGLNALTAHIAIVDARGDILWVNQAWRNFAPAYAPPGQRAGEGANYFDVCAHALPAEAAALAAGIRSVLTGERSYFIPECRWRPDGQEQDVWFSIRVTPLGDGSPPLAIVVHENITERKLAEARSIEFAREQAARAEAEALQERFAFLAEASALLASSLDYETTLARIPSLLVPQLADWCSVHFVSGQNQLAPVAYLHSDAAKTAALRPLVYEYTPNPEWGEHPISRALRTRRPLLIAQVPEGWAEGTARDARHRDLLRLLAPSSLMALPLQARDELLGVLILAWTRPGRSYTVTDLVFAEQLAARAALAIDNARLYTSTQRAYSVALNAAGRLARMQSVTAALSEARLPEQVAEVLVHHALAAVGAGAGSVALLNDAGDALEVVLATGYAPGIIEQLRTVPMQAATPLTEAVRTTRPVWLSSEGDRADRYPHLATAFPVAPEQAWAALPLVVEGRAIGAFGLSFTTAQPFDEEARSFMLTLADQCAQAMHRAQLYAAAQQARAAAETARQQAGRRARRMQALAEAGHAFAEVLHDPSAALERITRYISELQGDLCVVRLLSEDGEWLTSVALHHPDPDALAMLRSVAPVRLPARASRLHGAVVVSGESNLLLITSREQMHALSSPEFWPFYERYGVQNVLVVPLRARGRVIGTMAVFRPTSKAPFTADEQSFLEALADRAALTVENARLYREAQMQRRHLEAVLDQIPEAVFICIPPDGAPLSSNRTAGEFGRQLGLAPDMNDWSTLRFFETDGRPVPSEHLPLLRALRGETVIGAELAIEGVNGTRVVVLASAAPIQDDDGMITSGVLVFRDITERKSLERMKDDFMSLAAHELRTPLTVLIGQTQLMARRLRSAQPSRVAVQEEQTGLDPERMLLSLGDILGSAQDMARLVNELLDLSRIETGRLELKPQPAELSDLLRKVVERHRQLHPDRSFAIEGADTPVWGVWDAGRLEQVFTNLLENAAKYSSGGRPVALRMTPGVGLVQVAVQDWGIGIPPDDLPHVFDRHYRAGNVGRASTGLGLGLYLTRQLVELHGGTITAESAEGEGSTFTVTLPVEERVE